MERFRYAGLNDKTVMSWKPKILDVYITKKFMVTFFVALLLIIGIIIIFDLSEKVDDFVQKKAPIQAILFKYYLNFIPYYMNMFSPLFVFITVIFFTSRRAANSEIVAILSCGVSFHRMMVPYIFSAAIIAMLSLSLNLWVIPRANSVRHEFENTYVKKKNTLAQENVHYQINPGEYVYVQSFSKWNNTAYKFTLKKIEGKNLISKISAESAAWDSVGRFWHLKKCFVREMENGILRDKVYLREEIDTTLSLTIEDFYRRKNTVQDLPQDQLTDLISMQELRGDKDIKYALIEYHNRFALPFSAFILTLIGVSLSSKKKRGGLGWNLATGIALSFSYILFMRFSEMFVFTDTMPAGLAIWFPNIIYAIIAVVLYRLYES